MRKVILSIVMLAATVAAFWWIFRDVDPDLARETLARASWFWVGMAVVANILGMLAQSWRLHRLLSPVARTSAQSAFRATVISFAGSNILPFRGGELLKAHLISRGANIDYSTTVGVITLEHLFNGVGLLGIAVVGLEIGGHPSWLLRLVLYGGLIIPAVVLLLYLLRPRKNVLARFKAIRTFLQRLHLGLAASRSPRILSSLVGLTACSWGFELIIAWCALHALHIEPTMLCATLMLLGVNAAGLIPLTPGQVGVYELAAVWVLREEGIPAGDAAVAAILYHLVHLVPTLLLAGGILMRTSKAEEDDGMGDGLPRKT